MTSYIGTILGIGTVCTTSYIAYAGREVNDIRGSNLLPFLGAAIVTLLIYYFVFPRIPTIGTRMKLIYGLILYNIIQYLIHTYSPTGLAIWKPDEVAKRDDTSEIRSSVREYPILSPTR